MSLRASQVELLRFVGEAGLLGRTMTECSSRFSIYKNEMWSQLAGLQRSGHLERHRSRFYLTQQGRDELTPADKGEAGA